MTLRMFWMTALATLALAAPDGSVVGTWQGKSAGKAAVTLTLNAEGDRLSGVPSSEIIGRFGWVGTQRDTLIGPKFDGRTLRFQVKNPENGIKRNDRDGDVIPFELTLTGSDEADLRLVGAGGQASTTHLVGRK